MKQRRRKTSRASTSSAPSSSRPCCALWRGDVIKRAWWMLLLAAAVPLAAQEPAEPQDTAEAARLRQQIEQRFHQIVRDRLALTDDQDAKLRATQEKFGAQRRDLMREQADHRQALDRQMLPGVAANPDSVQLHLQGIQRNQERLLRLQQDEDREMAGYLTPVQRAQYQMLRDRLANRLSELRRQRQGGGMGAPGMLGRPRAGGGMRPRAAPQQRPRRHP